MHERGILSIPDFIANSGGVIAVAIEYRGGTRRAAFEAIAANTRAMLDQAKAQRMSPREAAMKLARARIGDALAALASLSTPRRTALPRRQTQSTGSTWCNPMANDALSVIARFDVRRRRYLAPDGTAAAKLPGFAADAPSLVSLYRAMVLTRTFDLKAVSLQRTGRLGTYAVSLGQEGVSVGIASAMREEDVLLPSYRDNGTLLWRGVKMEEILLYWGGDERGSLSSGPAHDFPFCVPVGSQAPHAAGVAYAFKFRKEARVAVCLLGDGATSKGDVYEAMNFAGVHKLPLVFVINNNQWAISVPLKLQTASETLAQKAIASGFAGEQVDGNDVIAVRDAVEQAISAARSGNGPYLIEAVTYRLGDHTTADDAARYRPPEEVQARWKEEPIARLRAYLVNRKAWSKAEEEQLSAECHERVEAAVERYLATGPRAAETMFDHLYAELPAAYAGQRAEVERASHG
jgi:2-oxoisovalerate dehydrogenase E1 component alpha subunit